MTGSRTASWVFGLGSLCIASAGCAHAARPVPSGTLVELASTRSERVFVRDTQGIDVLVDPERTHARLTLVSGTVLELGAPLRLRRSGGSQALLIDAELGTVVIPADGIREEAILVRDPPRTALHWVLGVVAAFALTAATAAGVIAIYCSTTWCWGSG